MEKERFESNIEKAKLAELDILIELKRICEQNGIRYFLVGGTLIGAIRHSGFIPWDDDIDVGMLRKDYDRFKDLCKEQLCADYELVNWSTDSGSPNEYIKIMIKGTQYIEKIVENTEMKKGIFIDLFPFDNCPDNFFLQKIHGTKALIIRKMLGFKCKVRYDIVKNNRKKLMYKILYTISKIYTKQNLQNKFEHLCNRYNKEKTNYVVNLSGAYSYSLERKERKLLEDIASCKFEGYDFSIPRDYDKYLREIYGDYMIMPPAEDRKGRHEIVKIDFGNYVIKSTLQ